MTISDNKITQMTNTPNSNKRLHRFLSAIDETFPVPLSKKVNLENYAARVLQVGIVLKAETGNKLVGVLLGYANDTSTRRAYISTIGVIPQYREHGIGRELIEKMKSISLNSGMNTIAMHVHQTNAAAINFYGDNGFEVNDDYSQYLENSLYLVCELY